MIALVLERAGLDPTAVIGGRLSAFGSNARLGPGRVHGGGSRRERPLVPQAVAVDRGDDEHRSGAHGGIRQLRRPAAGVRRLRQQGAVLRRRRGVRPTMPSWRRCCRASRGGSSPTGSTPAGRASAHATSCSRASAARCTVWRGDRTGRRRPTRLGPLALQVPGRHSVSNALAAVAVGLELDVPFDAHRRRARRLPGRRAALPASWGPSAASRWSTTTAITRPRLRRWSRRRARRDPRAWCVAFQPHRYTRTRDADATSSAPRSREADEVVLTDIYAASEDPIPGVTRRGAGGGGQRPPRRPGARRAAASPTWRPPSPRSRAPAIWC